MKVCFTYTVQVTVDEEKGADVQSALEKVIEPFDSNATIDETDATEVEDSGPEGDGSED